MSVGVGENALQLPFHLHTYFRIISNGNIIRVFGVFLGNWMPIFLKYLSDGCVLLVCGWRVPSFPGGSEPGKGIDCIMQSADNYRPVQVCIVGHNFC